MTKNEFILKAMLQLAGTGQYKDQYEKVYEDQYECKRLVTKEKRIFDDAVKLAATAEAFLWEGDVSNPKSVLLEDATLDSNENGLIAETLRYKKEKQGEQKPTDEEMKVLLRTEYEKGRADAIAEKPWGEEDETVLNNLIYALANDRIGNNRDEYVDWLKSIKDRVQPQPKQEWSEEDELSCFESALFTAFSDAWQEYLNGEEVNVKQWAKEHSKEILEAAKEELKEQKPAAWSEDDQSNFNELSSFILETYRAEDASRLITWLDYLKERVQPQPKQEWSEEDDEMLNLIIARLHSHPNIDLEEYSKEYDWLNYRLKSLRPQSYWKPSDEQMHYLSWIANIKLGDSVVEQEVSKHLNELLEDLKKLREE